MASLFDVAPAGKKPLAAELRPATLDDIVGHEKLIGPDGKLRRRVNAGRLGCVILFGPSGTGKTTIAAAVGAAMRKEFHRLHPARTSVADVKKIAESAKMRPTLVFVDEIHRFTSTQQDHFLELCEDGVFDLIGATTGNPFHVLTTALTSRSTLMKIDLLRPEEIVRVLERAVGKLAEKKVRVVLSDGDVKTIAARSGGDARRALNVLETFVIDACPGEPVVVTSEMVAEALEDSPIPYDRNGDAHYDIVSAFVKSMRGGDPDGTLYWLARMILGGEDPRYIARRIMIHAAEDVGLADNAALHTAAAALAAVESIGMPEARIPLAQAALHVCLAPKSNSACRGIAAALEYVGSQPPLPVPSNLRDTHYKGAASLGAGGYQFPHDTDIGWCDQQYAPPGVAPGAFYVSDARDAATFEKRADAYWEGIKGRLSPRRFPR